MSIPPLGPSVPQRGNPLTGAFGRLVLRLLGWRFSGVFPNLPKLIIIVAPHTSNWDFIVGMAARIALGFRSSFFGKHSLFYPPLGWLMRWLDGIPVERHATNGVVDQAVRTFQRRPQMVLALAPEGTRGQVARWRTGFYHIAHQAGVPILPVAFDYPSHTIRFGEPLWASGDLHADFARLLQFFAAAQGRIPKPLPVADILAALPAALPAAQPSPSDP